MDRLEGDGRDAVGDTLRLEDVMESALVEMISSEGRTPLYLLVLAWMWYDFRSLL